MASPIELKLTNRSPKKPIRKLPSSVSILDDTTIEGLKVLIAKTCGISDHNRIGIFDPKTKKTFKNRKAKLSDEAPIVNQGEVLVKDLGPQLGWRTVYVIEYIGPLLFHPLTIALRPYIYPGSPSVSDLSNTQWLAFALIMLHYIKRELETLFVHKFSANTMPFFNVFKNSAFYWIVSGLINAYTIYHPWSLAQRASNPIVDVAGAGLWLLGEVANARVHLYLASLRTWGGTERQIPVGYGFSFVTCPNYMYELIAWAGMIIVSRDPGVFIAIFIGAVQMYFWGQSKEAAYRKEFGDRYKKKRYILVPGLV